MYHNYHWLVGIQEKAEICRAILRKVKQRREWKARMADQMSLMAEKERLAQAKIEMRSAAQECLGLIEEVKKNLEERSAEEKRKRKTEKRKENREKNNPLRAERKRQRKLVMQMKESKGPRVDLGVGFCNSHSRKGVEFL
ncbi:hypothetical protein B0T21DRAFT_408333 [Apiosordaria backusii]|uniref:Uncharacterized protein n=1 Tax=Apiosordaria backusii TaxID=314023 RepID=A0AA40ETQ2_9PEZI|nr:hypothetical protein B0T21DRAFT_408333 [Apiosordaria backusii]